MPLTDVAKPPRSWRDRMSSGESTGPIHPTTTRKSAYRYLFYVKHHGRGGPDAAQWLESLSHDEEFAVFDTADFHDLGDRLKWLYGVRIGPEGTILQLGTWGQQVAEFPAAHENEPWHGYPLWPLNEVGPANRRGEKHRPGQDVFRSMEDAKLLTTSERKRLQKGKHV